MMKIVFLLTLSLCLAVAPAQAQLTRTFVSAANGNDVNNCDRLTPCRSFQTAHDKTSDQGEITVLDPGGYGPLTITKSISVVNDGIGEASIQPSGGTGITVNAGATGRVNLRGITIQGQGTDSGGGTGLRFNSGFALTITNCVVRNHGANGIELLPSVASNIAISNTLVADNGGDGIALVASGSGTVNAVYDHVEVYNNRRGIVLDGSASSAPDPGLFLNVTDSIVHNNPQAGVYVVSNGKIPNVQSVSMVVRSVVANNGPAFDSDLTKQGGMLPSQSTVTGNTRTWFGLQASYGDNYVAGNGDGAPSADFVPPKK